MKQVIHPIFPTVKKHPMAAELRLCLRRLGIVWQLHCINAQNRRAAMDLAYDRAQVSLKKRNFQALLISNKQRREGYRQQLKALMEAGNDQ